MKKLLILLWVTSLFFELRAQDISGTLGSGGNFIVEDNGGTQLFKVNSSGAAYFGLGSNGFQGSRVLNVLHQNSSAGISLNSYLGNGFSARSRIDFHTNQGSVGSLITAANGDPIGWLIFNGYDGLGWYPGAEILVHVDGNASSGHVPMSINFKTDDGSSTSSRFLIKSDGTINIPGLSGTGTEYVKVDANGNLVRSATKEPSRNEINEKIRQLEEENEKLKNELFELKKTVTKLMKK